MAAASAGDTLPVSLAAIAAQDYAGPVEVVVAAADTETAEVASRFDVLVIQNRSGTTPAGLNLAVAAGSGEILVRVDAQSVIPPDYVRRIVERLADTGAGNVGGMQVPVGQTFLEKAIAASMGSRVGAGDARYRIGGPAGPTDTVYLGSFRRTTFEAVGGYDERYLRNQDYELNHRIRSSGGTVWLEPTISVTYRPRPSLGKLASQYFGYGTWKRVFSAENPGSLRARQWAPPILVILLAVSLAASLFWPWALLMPAAYVTSLVAASLVALPTVGAPALAMPACLAVMHVSWGVGFLLGQARER